MHSVHSHLVLDPKVMPPNHVFLEGCKLFGVGWKERHWVTLFWECPHYGFVKENLKAITCSKLTIETLEQGVKHVQN